MIIIIDYGLGNLGSVQNAFDYLKVPAKISSKPADIKKASGVILPGVGAAGEGMKFLREQKLDTVVRDVAESGKPLFGICLGMQLLFSFSEENDTECLGILAGQVKLFKSSSLKVPQIGWNPITVQGNYKDHPLFKDVQDNGYAYFVHSYYCVPDDGELVAAKTNYNNDFCSISIKDNVMAAQFHPEKSSEVGLQLLQNFATMCK